jgi:hydroxymethylpyrimidine pyrophosphatase-like HAD family hydrolase
MEIIVPAAGLSTRFPGMKPKYLLFDYKGDLMLKNSLYPYIGRYNITIGILKEHNDEYNAKEYIESEIPGINVIVLNERTKGPADTVYQIIKCSGVEDDKEILIKDCDNFFEHTYSTGNYICVSNIAEHEVLKKLSSKSFVISNDQGIITNIIEKNVVSDTFCVGAYKFESVKLFKDTFEKLSKNIPEVFVSHVIQDCLMEKHIFIEKPVTKYIDVGTSQDWFEFNDKPTIFCDIDGTIIKAQGRYGDNSYDNEPIILEENVKRLKELKQKGAQIIFTTSRPLYAEEQTKNLLDKLGFSDCAFLIGLNISRRIIINDYNSSNPYPRAEAINIKRDSDNLKEFL